MGHGCGNSASLYREGLAFVLMAEGVSPCSRGGGGVPALGASHTPSVSSCWV